MNSMEKRILLVDLDDSRRSSRVQLLQSAGHEVIARAGQVISDEGSFDLIVVALNDEPEAAAAVAYSDRLLLLFPDLPILLLTDYGVFVPLGALSHSLQAGDPKQLIDQVSTMLDVSLRIRDALTPPPT
jgi:hypothetical protein